MRPASIVPSLHPGHVGVQSAVPPSEDPVALGHRTTALRVIQRADYRRRQRKFVSGPHTKSLFTIRNELLLAG